MRSRLSEFFREPLVQFLAIGASFFLWWHLIGDRVTPQTGRIAITSGQVERLAQQWTKTHLRPPTAQELADLVDAEIDEEILYREAVALGLDRDDIVIRRRLAVKMDFLTEDAAATTTPSDQELEEFLAEHPDKFNVELLTSFAQVFVNRSQRGESSMAHAEHLLSLLRDKASSDWRSLGDPLPLPSEYEAVAENEIARRFGRDFPRRLAALPVGSWSGPVESSYGLHLVLVQKRMAARIPPLTEVRDEVLREWRAEQRRELGSNLRRQRRARYAVTVQWPDWAQEAMTPSTSTRARGGSR